MDIAVLLKHRFPWLGTDEDAGSGADVIQELDDFYQLHLTPVATITRGKLVCSCGAKEVPRLSEHGYSVTHDLISIGRHAGIKARGWDGNSNKISEEGSHYTLECTSCMKQHRLPDGMDVNWSGMDL